MISKIFSRGCKIGETTLDLRTRYEKQTAKKITLIAISGLVTIFVALYTMTIGTAEITLLQIKDTLLKLVIVDTLTVAEKIILHLRIPRVALAMLAGAGLALAGTVMQGITRNPLVSPFTVGISSAAAFGASLAIVFNIGFNTHTSYGVVLTAFFFALICAGLVYGIASKVGLTPETLILTGIALNYLFSALTGTIHFFSKEYQLASAVDWTFGSFNGATWGQVGLVAIILAGSLPVLYRMAWILNTMAFNDDDVLKGLGIDPAKNRGIAGIISVLITAAIISFTGVIGFVGLVAPHISRLIIGADHRFLIPFSAIAGSLLLVISDAIGRVILALVMVPVGIVVSYLGVPLFINLIITRRKGYFK